METDTSVTIRNAVKEDMIQVHALIRELAEFEKMENQMKISPSVLEEDGFGPNPIFNCVVAEATTDKKIIGYALYYTAYSTWLGESTFLEDLYVQPSHRNTGIGKKLFTSVAKVAYERPSKRLDFHVLSWNPASNFYKSLGATNLSELEKWELYRLEEEGLRKLLT